MAETWRYRGQEIGSEQIVFLREFIRTHPTSSRWKLSRQLCEALGWKQANGALRDMVCRGLLLMLERAGEIELPPVRRHIRGQCRTGRPRPEAVLIDDTPLAMPLKALGPIEIQPVRRTADEPLFNSLMEHYHYLAYEQPVGEHLKYLAWAQGRPIACLAWSSAPRHLGSRDRYIGWSAEARRRNIRFIAYNTRFLILPWVRVPHLASHILGKVTRALSDDWERMYGHPVYFAETFIDPGRFRGTCYRAANWQLLGLTTGRGKNDQTNKPNRPIKEILGLPLTRAFPRVPQPAMTMTTGRREPGRTGSDHRSQHARAAERIGRPEAQNRAACHGRETAARNGARRKPVPFCRRIRRRQASRIPANRLQPVMGAMPAAAFTWRKSGCRRARHAPFRRHVPGVPPAEKSTARRSRQRW